MTIRVGGMTPTELARAHGTPLYAFDAAVIRRRVEELRGSVLDPAPRIFFSVKAHPSVAILRLLRTLGVGADACSAGELAYARAAGFEGGDLTFTTVSLTEEDVDAVTEAGAFFVADSLDQVQTYASRSDRREDIGLRVAPGITAGFDPLVQAGAPGAKFGIAPGGIAPAVAAAGAAGLRVTCLHLHLGSDLVSHEPHVRSLDLLLELAGSAAPDVTAVDLGGGWCPPFPSDAAGTEYPVELPQPTYSLTAFGAAVSSRLAAFFASTGRDLELRLEPGAHLTMDAGHLITSVIAVKASGRDFDGPRPMAVVDAGHQHLYSSVVHGTVHAARLDGDEDRPLLAQDVGGHLMQAGDLLARNRVLPELRTGDVLTFHGAGAYKACRASVFNGRPRPAEVLVADGSARLIRRRETVADLLSYEVPEGSEIEPGGQG